MYPQKRDPGIFEHFIRAGDTLFFSLQGCNTNEEQ